MIIDKPFDGIYPGKDVEAELKRYMVQLQTYFGDKPIYEPEKHIKERVVVPEGYNVKIKGDTFNRYPKKSQKEIIDFWSLHMNRIRNGYDDMCGLQYLYFNFSRLHGGKSKAKHIESTHTRSLDTITAESKDLVRYRRADNWMHKLAEDCIWGERKGQGMLVMGRRREGKSSKACNIIHGMNLRMNNINMVLTSKTEDDAQRILMGNKIQFMYDRYPVPLKRSLLKRGRGLLHFGKSEKDDAGNRMIKGADNKILAVASTSESVEGETVMAWIHDEALKTRNFDTLFKYTYPALADEEGFELDGFIICLGVAGEESLNSGFSTIWNAADTFNMIRVFLPGWYGLEVDECGNENIQAGVRKILSRRNRIWKDSNLTQRQKEEFIRSDQQQYPLTVQESFASASVSKWDDERILNQLTYLRNNPNSLSTGTLEWDIKGSLSRFTPNVDGGKYYILEHPKLTAKYIGGGDVYGLKQGDIGSSGAFFIWKMKNPDISPSAEINILNKISESQDFFERLELYLKLGDMPVALYLEDHKDPQVMGDGIAKLCLYYSRGKDIHDITKACVENEPPIVKSFLNTNYPHLVQFHPMRKDRLPSKSEFEKTGIDKKGYFLSMMMDEIGWSINNLCDRIFFTMLLEKFSSYDETDKRKKHDIVDAYGNTLLVRVDPRIEEWAKISMKAVVKDEKPIFGFKRI